MSRKALLRSCIGLALFLPACATVREKARPSPPPPSPTAAVAAPAPSPAPPRPETKPRVAPRQPAPAGTKAAAPATRTDLPGMIGGNVSWTDAAQRSLVVSRGDPGARRPVPIFRQASVLASVRAALADSPARPEAEFRHGLLTLTFPRGSNAEIAGAVRRAMQNPEVAVMGVDLNP